MDWKKQVGALPVRRDKSGALRVLLVTSRETRRLVIPKGWPWPGVKDWKAAAEEAREEAGIRGRISKKPVGSYTYDKRRASDSVPVRVKVFLLEVEEEMSEWPESKERERLWCTPAKAAASVDEPELADLILQIAETTRQAKKPGKKEGGKAKG
jgi:8-oxo-dGTP pyrophosphatase MutT (NUDIX family)